MTAGRRCALPIGSSVRPKPANRTEVDAGSHGCDRASAKDFHEIRAVFTRGVA